MNRKLWQVTDNTPTIDQFRPVVLRVLSKGQERTIREVCELVADHLKLSEAVRAERIPSGQHRYVNRINWACSGLTQAGLLERPRRGHYQITDNGRAVDQRSLQEYTEKEMLEWPVWQAYQDEIAQRKQDVVGNEVGDASSGDPVDPIEALSAGERSFNAQTETDLRKRLQESLPEFFERAVIDVLGQWVTAAHTEKSSTWAVQATVALTA